MNSANNKLRALLLLSIFLGGTLAVFFSETNASAQQTTTNSVLRSTQTARDNASYASQSQQQPVRVPQLPPPVPQQTPRATPTPAPQQTPRPATTPTAAPTPAVTDETISDDDDIVRVTSNLVVVPVSVTDAKGEPVQGLKAADFRLEEEGRAQEIAQVGDAEQVPLDIAILFDVSSSVMGKIAFGFQQESAAGFLKQVLKPVDRAAIVTVAAEPTLVQPLTSAEAATAKLLTIPAATTSVPTAFYDAVSFASKYLSQNATGGRRRVILVISDGDDNFSAAVREQSVAEYDAQKKAEAEGGNRLTAVRAAARKDLQARHQRAVVAVQREVQRADVVFYSVNPSGLSIRLNEISTRAQNNMQQLADSTGGTAYVPDGSKDLERIFRQIAAELRAQYLLQYYSNSDAPNGKFLNIKVRTPTRADARVRARSGYYVKK
ncbi:MAG TPA: VWA domain-containing protein [Pyrinomonadaceae bacterium]|nr:VWA domain-containing protein [Pyrinomonadaceae bacterium]